MLWNANCCCQYCRVFSKVQLYKKKKENYSINFWIKCFPVYKLKFCKISNFDVWMGHGFCFRADLNLRLQRIDTKYFTFWFRCVTNGFGQILLRYFHYLFLWHIENMYECGNKNFTFVTGVQCNTGCLKKFFKKNHALSMYWLKCFPFKCPLNIGTPCRFSYFNLINGLEAGIFMRVCNVVQAWEDLQ